jgi:hypothetical protein
VNEFFRGFLIGASCMTIVFCVVVIWLGVRVDRAFKGYEQATKDLNDISKGGK